MNKISDIISTPVISLYESEFLGIIYNIMFDYRQKKCKYACILNEKENIQHLIKFSDIYKMGKECIFIKNKSQIELEQNCDKELEECSNPINLKAYNLEGEFLGTSNDILIDENFNINKIILNNGTTIESKKIFNIGNSAILINDKEINIAKFKPKQKIITPKDIDSKVMILSDFIEKEQKPQKAPIKENTNNNKIITDFRFLVGRILSKDIVALNGEMIAKNGAIITKDIVNKASFYGKLVEIARYSNKK